MFIFLLAKLCFFMKEVKIICNEEGIRLDKFIFNEIDKQYKDWFSRSRIQDIIKSNLLKKNDIIFTDVSYKTKIGDIFDIIIDDVKETTLKEKDIKLNIVYEDNDLLVINKQAGLTTHPGAGNYEDTLVNALLYYCKGNLSSVGGVLRPGIVHRLDKDTTGLMVVAKNDLAHNSLKNQLETRILKRTYNAIIWGNIIPQNGIIEGYIARHKQNRLKMCMSTIGRYSLTNYKTLKNFSIIASLVECKLNTGRTHQIRVHFSSKKHPLIGDQLYGGNLRKIAGEKNEYKHFVESFPRQALHSKSISFIQPSTKKELFFESNLPDDMIELINNLEKL